MTLRPKFLLIGFALLFILVGGFFLRSNDSKKSPIISQQNLSSEAKQSVKLSFHQNTQQYSKKSPLVITLDADTTTELNGLQFVLAYDPTMVSFVDAKPGPFFASPMVFAKKADDTAKVVIFALGSLTPRIGQGSAVEITFQPKKAGTVIFSLEPKSKASPQNGDPISVLLPDSQSYIVVND